MEFIVFPAVVLAQEHRNGKPRVFNCVGMGPRCRIDELDAVVDSLKRVTLGTKIAVSSPIIAYDRSAGFDPVTYYGHQCVGGSVRNGYKECFAGLAFNTTEHPLTLDRVSTMLLTLNEFTLINFDGRVGTISFNGAAP